MTPDLMEAGAQRRAAYEQRAKPAQAGGYGRPQTGDEVVFTQGVAR